MLHSCLNALITDTYPVTVQVLRKQGPQQTLKKRSAVLVQAAFGSKTATKATYVCIDCAFLTPHWDSTTTWRLSYLSSNSVIIFCVHTSISVLLRCWCCVCIGCLPPSSVQNRVCSSSSDSDSAQAQAAGSMMRGRHSTRCHPPIAAPCAVHLSAGMPSPVLTIHYLCFCNQTQSAYPAYLLLLVELCCVLRAGLRNKHRAAAKAAAETGPRQKAFQAKML